MGGNAYYFSLRFAPSAVRILLVHVLYRYRGFFSVPGSYFKQYLEFPLSWVVELLVSEIFLDHSRSFEFQPLYPFKTGMNLDTEIET